MNPKLNPDKILFRSLNGRFKSCKFCEGTKKKKEVIIRGGLVHEIQCRPYCRNGWPYSKEKCFVEELFEEGFPFDIKSKLPLTALRKIVEMA